MMFRSDWGQDVSAHQGDRALGRSADVNSERLLTPQQNAPPIIITRLERLRMSMSDETNVDCLAVAIVRSCHTRWEIFRHATY